MIIVAGTVRIEPNKLQEARGIMERMIAASRAEDGCIEYSYSVDVLDPRVVHVFEAWRDQETLQKHFKMPHLAEWRAAWPSFGISDRKLHMYEVSGSTPL
jgi:quinol monooxygenase YgiN